MCEIRFHLPSDKSCSTQVEGRDDVSHALDYIVKSNHLEEQEIRLFQQRDGSLDIRFVQQQRGSPA